MSAGSLGGGSVFERNHQGSDRPARGHSFCLHGGSVILLEPRLSSRRLAYPLGALLILPKALNGLSGASNGLVRACFGRKTAIRVPFGASNGHDRPEISHLGDHEWSPEDNDGSKRIREAPGRIIEASGRLTMVSGSINEAPRRIREAPTRITKASGRISEAPGRLTMASGD